MRIKNTTLAILWPIIFVGSVALAAAGDRYFSNPTSNKDVVIQVNKAGVTTDVIKAVGSTGAVTVGPAASTATNLKVNGDATFGNGSTGNRALTIQGSTYAALRLADTSDANAINIRNNLSGASGEILYGATQVGSFSSAGAWTLGPVTADSALFVYYGNLWATSGSHYSSLGDGSSFYSGKGGTITVVDKTTPETCVFACVLNLAETAGSCVVVADVGGSNCSSSFGQATKISCGYSASAIRCANNRGAIDVGVFSTSMN